MMKYFGKKFWAILLSAIMTVSAVSGPVALAAEEPSADEQEALLEQVIQSIGMEQGDFPEDAPLEASSLDDEAVSSVRADYLTLMAEEAAQNGAEAYEAEALTEPEEGLTVSPEDLMAGMDAIVSGMESDEVRETALEAGGNDIEECLESFRQARMELEAETPAEQDGDSMELSAANVATAYLVNRAKTCGTYNSSSNSYSYRYYTEYYTSSSATTRFDYYVYYDASEDRLSLEMTSTSGSGSSYCSVDFDASLAVPYKGWIMVGSNCGVVNVYPASFSSSTKYYSSDFVFYDGYRGNKASMADLVSAGLQLVVRTSHTMLLSKAGYSVGDLKFTRIASPSSKGSAGIGGISSVNTSRSAAFNRLGTLAVQKGEYNSSGNYYVLAAFDSFTSTDFRYEYNVVYYVDSDAIALTELAYDRYGRNDFSAFSGLVIGSDLSSPYMGYVACTYEGIRTEGTFSVYPKTYTVYTEYSASDFVTFTGAASLKKSMAELFTSALLRILAETQKYLLIPASLSVSDLGFTSLIGSSSRPSAVPVTDVSLSAEELTIGKGKTATLTATVSPTNATDKTVIWSSSNSAVATVSKGKVKGVAGGTCTITATCGGKSASCSVTVVETITGLKLSSTKLSLAGGQDAELTVAIKGGANATYDLVAVYDSDLMSVIKTDETTFLITAGSRATTGAELKIIDRVTNKSAKCKVAVGLPADIVKTTMKSTDVNLLLGKSATLKAVAAIAGSSVKPINTKVSWYSSDESVAVVSSKGKVTTVGVGECTIYAEAVAGSDDCEPLAFDVTVVPVIKSFTLYDPYGLKFSKYTAQSGETLYLEDYITSNSIVWKAGRPDDGMVSFTYSMKAPAGAAELDEESGELLCLGKGKATVTVTLRCGTQKKTAKVTVTIA